MVGYFRSILHSCLGAKAVLGKQEMSRGLVRKG